MQFLQFYLRKKIFNFSCRTVIGNYFKNMNLWKRNWAKEELLNRTLKTKQGTFDIFTNRSIKYMMEYYFFSILIITELYIPIDQLWFDIT